MPLGPLLTPNPFDLYADAVVNVTLGLASTVAPVNEVYRDGRAVRTYLETSEFVVPEGVTEISAIAVGGGGGGAVGGGGGGVVTVVERIPVTPGDVYEIVVGQGGAPGTTSGVDGDDGGEGGWSAFGPPAPLIPTRTPETAYLCWASNDNPNWNGYGATDAAYLAFDRDAETAWESDDVACWLACTAGSGALALRYAVTADADDAPAAWTLEGGWKTGEHLVDEGGNLYDPIDWRVLDAQSAQVFTDGETKVFDLPMLAEYAGNPFAAANSAYFRLNVTASSGETVRVIEFQLYKAGLCHALGGGGGGTWGHHGHDGGCGGGAGGGEGPAETFTYTNGGQPMGPNSSGHGGGFSAPNCAGAGGGGSGDWTSIYPKNSESATLPGYGGQARTVDETDYSGGGSGGTAAATPDFTAREAFGGGGETPSSGETEADGTDGIDGLGGGGSGAVSLFESVKTGGAGGCGCVVVSWASEYATSGADEGPDAGVVLYRAQMGLSVRVEAEAIGEYADAVLWTQTPVALESVDATVLEAFTTHVGFTTSGGLTVETNASEHLPDAEASVKATSAVGTSGYFYKSGLALDLSGRGAGRIAFYVHDRTTLSSIQVVLGNNSSNFFAATITVANMLRDGWNVIDVLPYQWGVGSGAPSWDATFTRLQFRVNPKAGESAVVSFGLLEFGRKNLPAVSIQFDDADPSVYDEAYAYMAPRGIAGTFYVIGGDIGGESKVSAAQLQQMYASGWDIGNHTQTHPDLTTLTQEQVADEVAACGTTLDALGMTRASAHLAYPGGYFNETAIAGCIDGGMLSCRTGASAYFDQVPLPDPFAMHRRISLTSATSLATAMAAVDRAVSDEAPVLIVGHHIVETPAPTLEWSIADFRALIDYIVASHVLCPTVTQLYSGVFSSRNLLSHITVQTGIQARVRAHAGDALPATVWDWNEPELDPELLRTLRVRLATKDGEFTTVDPAELADLRVQLSRKGGVESIEVTLARDSRIDYGDLDYWTRCEVEYLGRVWPAFVREASLDHGRSSMTRSVRMLGHIAKLSERHRSFRRIYVDSRVSAFRTDQGPQTRSYGFETSATGGGD